MLALFIISGVFAALYARERVLRAAMKSERDAARAALDALRDAQSQIIEGMEGLTQKLLSGLPTAHTPEAFDAKGDDGDVWDEMGDEERAQTEAACTAWHKQTVKRAA